MAYSGFVARLENVRAHPNADRLQLADVFGNTVIVGLDNKTGDTMVYFPVDGQLSEEYCAHNNLVRVKDENGNNIGGYLDPVKRNIRALKLRGEQSNGLVMPLESLNYCGHVSLEVGDTITVVNGHEICCKYIPLTRQRHESNPKSKNKGKKKVKTPRAPMFLEHVDTSHLEYNLAQFKPGDEVEITLKIHGTSQRSAHLPVFSGYKRRSFWQWLTHKSREPLYEKLGFVHGTRRMVLDGFEEGGWYGGNGFREPFARAIEKRLEPGYTIYYEVAGYTDTGRPIMPGASNKELPKDLRQLYGSNTEFSYGCDPNGADGKPSAEMYVYRMTITDLNGTAHEVPPMMMRMWCDQHGFKTVPVLWRGQIPENVENAGQWIQEKAMDYYDGPDPIGKTHVREGVVVRIVNRLTFAAYKYKNFTFRQLSGLAVEKAADNGEDIDLTLVEEM